LGGKHTAAHPPLLRSPTPPSLCSTRRQVEHPRCHLLRAGHHEPHTGSRKEPPGPGLQEWAGWCHQGSLRLARPVPRSFPLSHAWHLPDPTWPRYADDTHVMLSVAAHDSCEGLRWLASDLLGGCHSPHVPSRSAIECIHVPSRSVLSACAPDRARGSRRWLLPQWVRVSTHLCRALSRNAMC
jgi:hypothetical protein